MTSPKPLSPVLRNPRKPLPKMPLELGLEGQEVRQWDLLNVEVRGGDSPGKEVLVCIGPSE